MVDCGHLVIDAHGRCENCFKFMGADVAIDRAQQVAEPPEPKHAENCTCTTCQFGIDTEDAEKIFPKEY